MKIFSLLFGSERVKENVIVSAKHHESKVCDFFFSSQSFSFISY